MNDGIVYFELWDSAGTLIVKEGSTEQLDPEFILNHKNNFSIGSLRNAYRENEHGSVRVVVDKNHPDFPAGAAVRRACGIYLSLIPRIQQFRDSERQHFDAIIRRFAHNLIKFQKRFKDNFARLISDKARSRPYKDFQKEVERRIKGNTSIAANDICQMSHRAIDLDAQIETLRIIAGYADATGSFLKADISKAIFRLTNPFIDELRKKGVTIDIKINSDHSAKYKIPIIHDLFNASIWQLLDNISKYSMSNSEVVISADLQTRPQKLFISTTSVSIESDETDLIFLEGRRGKYIKSGAAGKLSQEGSGIGMYIVRKALSFMNATISVTNEAFVEEKNGCPYSKHLFIITFNTKKGRATGGRATGGQNT
ncbi:MAG: ATP-binding protein [Candidatus Aureabacteria bacterium]|nr:ATP-binding protein [Candidatus Auribacterota bacterium]MCK5161830.1 ATP-binding protein [Candidatus Auribacterota bacterium]